MRNQSSVVSHQSSAGIVVGLVVLLGAQGVAACPPSAPLLYDVPQEKRTEQYDEDVKTAHDARGKLWAVCYEHPSDDCSAQCDATMLINYKHAKGDVRYQYSSDERKAAEKLIDALERKWNSTPGPKSHNWEPVT